MTSKEKKPETLKVAVGQFAVSEDWKNNSEEAGILIQSAQAEAVDLLVLPEGIMTRFLDKKELIREVAQPVSGPFVNSVLDFTRNSQLTVVFGIHEKSHEPRPFNTSLVVRDGEIIAKYRKLHLYDAFGAIESENVLAGSVVPPIFEVNGFRVGLMTCYDIRFPEQARDLADRGAEIIALPAAWANGQNKEFQWETLVSARALDSTCYLLASGESGKSCIGSSMIASPLGVPIARCIEESGISTAIITKEYLASTRRKLPVLQHRKYRLDFRP